MFKSIFSKYLTAFIISMLVSFLILSGIITSIISTYATEDKEEELYKTVSVVAAHIETENVQDLQTYVTSSIMSKIVIPIINRDDDVDLIITDKSGRVMLSTMDNVSVVVDGVKIPAISGDLGKIDTSVFVEKNNEEGDNYLVHRGKLGRYVDVTSVACASSIVTGGEIRGYVISLSASEDEDNLMSVAMRATFHASAWVMLAAIIAIYFISERIISPLRNMTSASKKLAKGDYSARVAVTGEGEVADLGNAFNNMAESLENLDKMRSSFMASVSHDLRTPMTTISGFIEGITSGAIPPEKHDYYLGVISTEVHRLSRLVSQLLDVTRLESGDRKFSFVDFDVAEVARLILISFEQKIDDKRLDVNFESDENDMYVHADKDAIYQVLYNLCHNAIKFASEGGLFEIKITRTESKKVLVSVFNEGKTISKDDQPMVFDRFYKSDKSRGLDKTGVGLGLYISKTIIDAHDETINVRNKDDVGTEFYFTLKEGEPNLKRQYDGRDKS